MNTLAAILGDPYACFLIGLLIAELIFIIMLFDHYQPED